MRIRSLLAFGVFLFLASSLLAGSASAGEPARADAMVSLSERPAQRAAAVSSTQPVLSPMNDMILGVGSVVFQDVSASDADGDLIVLTKASGPPFMTLSVNSSSPGFISGYVTLRPDSASDAGAYTAAVRARDLSGSSDTVSFMIRVD